MTMTGGKGVDVVLNSLAGEALRATWKCLAPFGRFIELGKKDAITGGSLEMAPFLKNVAYAGVNIAAMMYEVPLRACKIIEEAIDMFMNKKIRAPYPLSVYNFSQIELAFRQMQSGKASGKIVFCPNADDVVPVSCSGSSAMSKY
jgi:NADPH:quinone reductase-like Zn-dependent oxidoreductase